MPHFSLNICSVIRGLQMTSNFTKPIVIQKLQRGTLTISTNA